MAKAFTRYHILLIALLAFLQFTVVLDFMILAPLGAILMDQMHITTQQFGLVVSAYAFSAGASGILSAGFADRFDRKTLLLCFYTGFVLGTFLCAVAESYQFLLFARVVTGLFGGVMGSISFAIIADVFPLEVRGRVMGFVGTAFSASQVLGIPAALYVSNLWGWHAPFLMIVGVASVVGVAAFLRMQPINEHLKAPRPANAFVHLWATVSKPRYLMGFAATMLLATGGFMLMPFGSAFAVRNLGLTMQELPLVYMVTGIFTLFVGPLMGRLADVVGKYRMFVTGSLLGGAVVVFYCSLSTTPLWQVIAVNMVLFMTINARMVSSQALTSAVPEMKDRGAFMAVNTSLQQLSGGVSSTVAGLIVVQGETGPLEHYQLLGVVVACAMVATVVLMYPIHKMAQEKVLVPALKAEVPVATPADPS